VEGDARLHESHLGIGEVAEHGVEEVGVREVVEVEDRHDLAVGARERRAVRIVEQPGAVRIADADGGAQALGDQRVRLVVDGNEDVDRQAVAGGRRGRPLDVQIDEPGAVELAEDVERGEREAAGQERIGEAAVGTPASY
jgi:hypothetical protein